MIAIAVGNIQLVRRRMHEHVGRLMDVHRVAVASALTTFPDLHDELAGVRELQNHVVRATAGCWLGPSTVAADPNESLGVNRDAVLALGPVEPGSVAAPAGEQLT